MTYTMSPIALRQRSEAGKLGYRANVKRIILLHWPDPDKAAKSLSGFLRLKMGQRQIHGVTRRYILEYCAAFGLLESKELQEWLSLH